MSLKSALSLRRPHLTSLMTFITVESLYYEAHFQFDWILNLFHDWEDDGSKNISIYLMSSINSCQNIYSKNSKIFVTDPSQTNMLPPDYWCKWCLWPAWVVSPSPWLQHHNTTQTFQRHPAGVFLILATVHLGLKNPGDNIWITRCLTQDCPSFNPGEVASRVQHGAQ